MSNILDVLYSWLAFLPRITVKNLFEIIIIAVLVYEILLWIQNTRAWTLLKGIVLILIFALVAYVLRLDTIIWLIEKTVLVGTTAIIIIFQPELRNALEQLGKKNVITNFLSLDDKKADNEFNEKTINELAKATFELAKVKTGALMVIEQSVSLKEIERTGIEINGLLTSQLLINIFEHNTPLHDGAVVIRGNRVTAATCYLPLSDNTTISKDLGTRHRAAVGISEVSDSITIVVSEETGRVTIAEEGKLRRVSDADELKKILERIEQKSAEGNGFKIWKGRLKNERKNNK